MRQKIAIVGSGISGLGTAYLLSQDHDVTVFEADQRLGGHSHTVDVHVDGQRFGVDTGFLVFNERTYPLLCRLFAHLKIPVAKSDMSFSVQMISSGLEWAGTNLNTVFAQRRNLLSPAFWSMLRDTLRFNRQAIRDLNNPEMSNLSLGEYLDRHGYGAFFRDNYLLPMAAAIWSCPTDQMLAYPFTTFTQFCKNHGLLQIMNRPTWMTVAGGSRNYVQTLASAIREHGGKIHLSTPILEVRRTNDGVTILTENETEQFDQIVLACHSDQALRLLGDDATPTEREGLRAIRYQPNRAVLHSDRALLPTNPQVWSAWNYSATQDKRAVDANQSVSVSYLINKLQPLPTETPLIVSLNPNREPDPHLTYRTIYYEHPVFDQPAIAAQEKIQSISGANRTYFAGAWLGYGFHEDGFSSAVKVAAQLINLPQWLLDKQPAQHIVDMKNLEPEIVQA